MGRENAIWKNIIMVDNDTTFLEFITLFQMTSNINSGVGTISFELQRNVILPSVS